MVSNYMRKLKKPEGTKIKGEIIIYINVQYNNVIVTLTNLGGQVVEWFSSGSLGLKGFRKTSPLAAKHLATVLFERTKNYADKAFILKIKGINTIKKALLKYIGLRGLNIIKLEELSRIPFNGCRPQKKRKL